MKMRKESSTPSRKSNLNGPRIPNSVQDNLDGPEIIVETGKIIKKKKDIRKLIADEERAIEDLIDLEKCKYINLFILF